MNEIAHKEEFDFNKFAQDVELLTKICGQLMRTKHYATLGEAGVFAILQRAKALNLDPFDCLNGGMYYNAGRVGMSAELMASMIRKQGHHIVRDPESDDKFCTLHGKRIDSGDEWSCTFTIKDAERAGLLKNVFLKYPAVMLYNRAMTMLARQLFSDVIKGAGYDKDELEEIAENKEKKAKPIAFGNNIACSTSEPINITYEVDEKPITEEMEQRFGQLLKQCSQKFIENVGLHVMNNLKANSIRDIDYVEYKKLLDAIMEHIEKKKQKELENDGRRDERTNPDIQE